MRRGRGVDGFAVDLFDLGHGRAFPEPVAELADFGLGAADEDFDRTVGQVAGVTGQAQSLCFVAGAVTKEDALHPTPDPALAAKMHGTTMVAVCPTR